MQSSSKVPTKKSTKFFLSLPVHLKVLLVVVLPGRLERLQEGHQRVLRLQHQLPVAEGEHQAEALGGAVEQFLKEKKKYVKE